LYSTMFTPLQQLSISAMATATEEKSTMATADTENTADMVITAVMASMASTVNMVTTTNTVLTISTENMKQGGRNSEHTGKRKT